MTVHQGIPYEVFPLNTIGMGQSRRYEFAPQAAARFRAFVASHLPEHERTPANLADFATVALDYFARSETDPGASQVLPFRIGESEARAILMLVRGACVQPSDVLRFITNNLDELLDIQPAAQAA